MIHSINEWADYLSKVSSVIPDDDELFDCYIETERRSGLSFPYCVELTYGEGRTEFESVWLQLNHVDDDRFRNAKPLAAIPLKRLTDGEDSTVRIALIYNEVDEPYLAVETGWGYDLQPIHDVLSRVRGSDFLTEDE